MQDITEDIGFTLSEIPGIDRYLSLPTDVAFVSGSQQVGLGNSTSDYDLYIVYRDGLERLKEGPKQFWLKDPHRRVDLERHAWAEIAEAGRTVNSLEATPAATRHVPFDAFDIYYRTAVGRPMANETAFAGLIADLDTSRYDPVFAAWSLWQAGVELARARQCLLDDRQEAAFLSGRLALRHTVTASMARLGDGWPNPKWAFLKLARHYGRNSDEYEQAWALNGLGRRDLPEYVAAVGAYCEQRGVPYLVPSPPGATIYAWRGEVIEASIAGRSYVVHAKRDVYELDEAAAFLCGLIGGSNTLATIASAFAQRFDLALPVASYRAAEMLSGLAKAGILRSRNPFVLPEEVVGDDRA